MQSNKYANILVEFKEKQQHHYSEQGGHVSMAAKST